MPWCSSSRGRGRGPPSPSTTGHPRSCIWSTRSDSDLDPGLAAAGRSPSLVQAFSNQLRVDPSVSSVHVGEREARLHMRPTAIPDLGSRYRMHIAYPRDLRGEAISVMLVDQSDEGGSFGDL